MTDRGSSITEQVIRTIGILSKKLVFWKGNADWLTELTSVNKQKYLHNSQVKKTTPIQASKFMNGRIVFSKLQDRRTKRKPKLEIGDSIRKADFKNVFS